MTHATHSATSSQLSIVVTRANGTVEDFGVVSYWHKSLFKRALWRISRFLGL